MEGCTSDEILCNQVNTKLLPARSASTALESAPACSSDDIQPKSAPQIIPCNLVCNLYASRRLFSILSNNGLKVNIMSIAPCTAVCLNRSPYKCSFVVPYTNGCPLLTIQIDVYRFLYRCTSIASLFQHKLQLIIVVLWVESYCTKLSFQSHYALRRSSLLCLRGRVRGNHRGYVKETNEKLSRVVESKVEKSLRKDVIQIRYWRSTMTDKVRQNF